MDKKLVFSVCLLSVVGLICAMISPCYGAYRTNSLPRHHNMAYYRQELAQDVLPAFRYAKVGYPPQKIALLVFKCERELELWAQGKDHHWRFIRHFPVLGASGGPGPKLHQGDFQVPEGVYHISALNPYSHFDVSMKVDYPNAFDRAHARFDHRSHLGGDIFIHGGNLSIGCIALGNTAAEELFALVKLVGREHVTVVIAPNDLRHQHARIGRVRPPWLQVLDQRIASALAVFPYGQSHHG